MHPILDALDSSPYEWLKKMLFTFNEGNVGKFEGLAPILPQEVSYYYPTRGHPLMLHAQPILYDNFNLLRQKICLMALIESVFKRGSNDRTLSFQTISQETRLDIGEVEHLVMKALRCVTTSLRYAGPDIDFAASV